MPLPTVRGPMLVRDDCLHFNGYKPCKPHKDFGVHCDQCSHYRPASPRILVLKVGLAGEVLRCTPILRHLRRVHPDAEITWVTSYPDFVPARWVNRLLKHSWETAARLRAEEFDLVLSLDKDFDVCALADSIQTRERRGFGLNRQGRIVPRDERARRKWLTGAFDDLMLANTRHYVEEIFEICGFEYQGETYLLEDVERAPTPGDRPVVGLNTGASNVWTTRLWPEANWRSLATGLREKGLDVVLLGGALEDSRNRALAETTGARYGGVLPYRQFFGLVDSCDLVVTGVTMAMHVAIAREKPVVLFNNIFNRHEFHLYGRGEVIEPPGLPCLGCYKPRFDARCPVTNCMELIRPEAVVDAVLRWLPKAVIR